MISRKLSESDKQQILQLYRQPGETTSTLADRYGVSNSTISRILKSSFTEAEYELLIQQKRGNRSSSEVLPPLPLDSALLATATDAPLHEKSFIENANEASSIEDATPAESITEVTTADDVATLPAAMTTDAVSSALTANGRRLRKRSSAPPELLLSDPAPSEPLLSVAPPIVKPNLLVLTELTPSDFNDMVTVSPDAASEPYDKPIYAAPADAAEAMLSEELLHDEADLADDLDEDEDDLDDDDLDDDDLDDDDLDDDLENGALLAGSRIAGKTLVQVLPLAVASLPRTCYLVVDRSAELIARPLQEFGDLGQIPEAEILEKTLPIFDNHRVAKRYSNPRTQRVIKLPDAQVLQKTSSHLQAKGITRLLIDGQVYAL